VNLAWNGLGHMEAKPTLLSPPRRESRRRES
jgi:hypothetical protein